MSARIAVLLTSHNRKNTTLACLGALYAQQLPAGVRFSVYLVDDGCTDGTGDAVREFFPDANIVQGDGSLYWNAGMRLAFDHAMRRGFDYYLWLNDDTLLHQGSVAKLLATNKALRSGSVGDAIIAGTTIDPKTGQHTYGGLMRSSRWHPLKFRLVPPGDTPLRCLTMNGNCVLIPAEVARKVGNLSAEYCHSMGDTDYGLRAGRLGYSVWLAPGDVGMCTRNSALGTWEDKKLSLRERWKKVISPKGRPPKDWWVYCKRHAGPLWILFWCRPYVGMLVPVHNRPGQK